MTAIVLMTGAKVFHEVWCRCIKQHSDCAPDFLHKLSWHHVSGGICSYRNTTQHMQQSTKTAVAEVTESRWIEREWSVGSVSVSGLVSGVYSVLRRVVLKDSMLVVAANFQFNG